MAPHGPAGGHDIFPSSSQNNGHCGEHGAGSPAFSGGGGISRQRGSRGHGGAGASLGWGGTPQSNCLAAVHLFTGGHAGACLAAGVLTTAAAGGQSAKTKKIRIKPHVVCINDHKM